MVVMMCLIKQLKFEQVINWIKMLTKKVSIGKTILKLETIRAKSLRLEYICIFQRSSKNITVAEVESRRGRTVEGRKVHHIM